MKKTILSFVVAASALVSANAQAAAWYVPNNTRIVQVSNVDNTGRIYGPTSNQTQYAQNRYLHNAISSCTGTATNPCLIKLGPGTYDLGTATLQLSPYMELQGSGAEVTTIVSNNVNTDDQCRIGTVMMADHSSVSNLTIKNTAAAAAGQYLEVAALVFNGPDLQHPVTAKAEHVKAVTGSDTTPGGRNDAVCTLGDFADATVNDSVLESHNPAGNSNAMSTMGGRLLVTNSRFIVFQSGTNGGCHLVNDDNVGSAATVKIKNVLAEASCWNVYGVLAMYNSANELYVDDSKFVVNVDAGGYLEILNIAAGPTWIANTRFVTSGPSPVYDAQNAKLAASQLPGNIAGLAGSTLVNCYDQDFKAIPNP